MKASGKSNSARLQRIMSRVAVLLILGAVTTVGVAWCLMLNAQGKTPAQLELLEHSTELLAESGACKVSDTSKLWMYWHVSRITRGVACIEVESWECEELKDGCVKLSKPTCFARCVATAVVRHPPWTMYLPLDEGYGAREYFVGWPILSLTPAFRILWPGFLIDTAVYAAAWGLLVPLPGIARRALRRRRGLCVACAYDLCGLPAGTLCPECGQTRQGALA